MCLYIMMDADDHEGERYHVVQGFWDDPGDFLFHRRTVFFHSVPLRSKGGRYNIYPPTQTISRGSASEERQTEHGPATLLSSCRRTLPMHCHVSGLHCLAWCFGVADCMLEAWEVHFRSLVVWRLRTDVLESQKVTLVASLQAPPSRASFSATSALMRSSRHQGSSCHLIRTVQGEHSSPRQPTQGDHSVLQVQQTPKHHQLLLPPHVLVLDVCHDQRRSHQHERGGGPCLATQGLGHIHQWLVELQQDSHSHWDPCAEHRRMSSRTRQGLLM